MTHNMTMTRFFLLLALMVLPGCFSLAREEPVRQHFVLGGYEPPGTGAPGGEVSGGAASMDELTGLHIGLRQLQMAEYLDSPLIVVREGRHQIRYSEYNRWGGSLDSGVMRALESYLSALAPFEGVETAPWDRRVEHTFLIQVHLLRMEGVVPGNGVEGETRMVARWEIIGPGDGAVLVRGTTDYETSGWTVGDYERLVDELDAGLWKLSHDLASALTRLRASHRPD